MPTRTPVAKFGRSRVRTRRQAVASTAIRSIGYDEDLRDLDVEFRRSGAVYRYFEVTGTINTRFMNAASKGRFFNRNVRNVYDYSRIVGAATRQRRRKRSG